MANFDYFCSFIMKTKEMRRMRPFLVMLLLGAIAASCGVSGDPGHCYFSLDWEYYNEDYGVYYYEDNNPDVPESELIEPGLYYDCYPGTYDYYYESEDRDFVYTYEGFYTLVQNPGTPGGFLHDGMDGTDTYFDLYLYIYNRKGLPDAGAGVTSVSSAVGLDVMSSDHQSPMMREHLQGLPAACEEVIVAEPLRVERSTREVVRGSWTLRIEEEVHTYAK